DVPAQGSGLPQGRPIAVHCGHAQRAATALSVLERLGVRDLQLLHGGYQAWAAAGLPAERPA
ncbi:MAG: rhodanese-like domain-containing protein, partial [Chloroflexota bacterium]